MRGMGFHEALAKLQPRTANGVTFFTGGVFTPGAASFLERVSNQRLEKPFEPARLRALVNEQLRTAK